MESEFDTTDPEQVETLEDLHEYLRYRQHRAENYTPDLTTEETLVKAAQATAFGEILQIIEKQMSGGDEQ